MAASLAERLHVDDTLLETVSDDESFAGNSDKTITGDTDGISMDLEGFYEHGDTHFNQDSLDAAAGGNIAKDIECSGSASDRQQQQQRSRALETTSGMPKGRWGRRDDADEEGSSLGLSEMRLASISQHSPALEDEGERVGGVMDWRRSRSPIQRPDRGSGVSLSSRGSTITPGGGSASATPPPSVGREVEETSPLSGSKLPASETLLTTPTTSARWMSGTDPNRWMKRRVPASKGGRGSACGAANDVLDDSEILPKAPVSSQNILAIGVPVGRRVPGPQPRDPAPNAPDDRLEIEEGAEQEVEEGLGSTPSAINTQDIHPGNSSQVLKDCSQQRRKTDHDLDEAIAAAQAVIFGADEVAGGVCPSSARSPRPPFPQHEPVQGSHAPVVPECLSAFDHESRAHASKAGKRKEMRPSVPAATPTMQVEGTPVGNGRRGRAVSRTPGSYLGTSTSKTSVKLNKTPLRSPSDGANHPAKDIFDISSEEEEGEGAKITAAALTKTRAERQSGAQTFPKSRCLPRNGKIVEGKGKKASRADAPERGCAEAPPSGAGWREREEDDDRNRSSLCRDGGCECGVGGKIVAARESNGNEDARVHGTQDLLMQRTMEGIRNLTPTPGPLAPDPTDEGIGDDVGGGYADNEDEEDSRKPSDSKVRPKDGGRRVAAVKLCSARVGSLAGRKPCTNHPPEPEEEPRRGLSDSADPRYGANRAPEVEGTERCDDENAGAAVATFEGEGLLEYGHLCDFLRKREGWKHVRGHGDYNWVWILPGSREGKKGKAGVDFLANEDVVGYARHNKALLRRFRAFCATPAGNTTTPRAKKKRNKSEGGAVKRTEKEGRNGSPPRTGDPGARSTTGRLSRSKKRDGGRVAGGSSWKVGWKSPREGTGSGNEAFLKREVSRESMARNLYSKLWPDLQEQGWRWVKGKGLVTHVWLKDGVAKREGKRGINLFESIEEVVEHVLGVEALEGPPSDEAGSRSAGGDAWQRFKIVKGTPVLEAGGVTNLRSKRKRFQRNFLGGAPVEVEESGTDDGAPSAEACLKGAAAEEVGSLSSNGEKEGGDQTPGPCRSGSVEADSVSLPGGGTSGGAINSCASGAASALEGKPRSKPKRPPPAPVSKRRRTVRDDSSRRKLRDGACDEQLDAMVENESFLAAGGDEDDDGDIPTQPQFELSTAINMIDAGRSRNAEKQRAHGVTVGATVAAAAEVVEGADGPAVIPSGVELLLAVRAVSSPQGALEECRGTAASCPTAEQSSAVGRLESSPAPHGGARGRGHAEDASTIAASSPGSATGSSRRGDSPAVGVVSRASSARRPLAGVGFIVTGIRSEGGSTRQRIETSIKTLGGTVVDVFDAKSPVNAEWVDWLLRQGGGGGGARPPRPDGRLWMIAVSAPDGDRLSKVQVALAARMPIVHPSYVTACIKLGKDVGVSQYLLPFGRSALGDNGLVMPKYSEGPDGGGVALSVTPRDRPFSDRKILYYAGKGAMSNHLKVDTWEFTLRVAGAKVTTVVEGGEGRKPERGTTTLARAGTCCTLEVALDLLKRGQVDFVIGPNNDRSQASRRLDAAAREAGTMAGTVEWAAQCLIHARLLVPHAGTCPWFPMVATGGAGGDFDVDGGEVVGEEEGKVSDDAPGTLSGKGKKRKGRARGGGGRGSGCKVGAFHVLSGARRYVVGDYAFIRQGKNNPTGRGSKGKAAELPRVVRIRSFERGREGKVTIEATEMKRCDGRPEVLVEAAPVRLPEGALDSRVLVMSQQQILATQVYSLSDEGILCRDDEAT